MSEHNGRLPVRAAIRRGFVMGIEDQIVLAKTGRTWKEWTLVLDGWYEPGHDLAAAPKFLRNEYEISTWWANTITARYQWENGLAD